MSLVRPALRLARLAPPALALAVLTAASACASRDQQAATPSDPGQPAGQTAAQEAASAPAAAPETPAGEAPAGSAAEAADPAPSAPQTTGSAPSAAQTAAAPGYRRLELPGAEGYPFPYTVEVPEGWRVHEVQGSGSIWLGPDAAKPGEDPRMIFIRISPASLADAEAVAANIRASDEANPGWTAPVVEVRDLGEVKGVLVQMDSGEGEAARSTLALKLPLPKTSVDFMASAPRPEFDRLRPDYERILLSVRPVP